jgi:AraC-like DNA-binding protein
VRAFRLQQSLRDLRDPRLAHLHISEIAYRSGSSHLSTFNRSFRATFGLTPGQAREEHRHASSLTVGSTTDQAQSAREKRHHQWFREIGR